MTFNGVVGRKMAPKPESIVAVRERIQNSEGMGITAAQDVCADMLHTSRRAWQQWERGERRMHYAFWELVQIKSVTRSAHIE